MSTVVWTSRRRPHEFASRQLSQTLGSSQSFCTTPSSFTALAAAVLYALQVSIVGWGSKQLVLSMAHILDEGSPQPAPKVASLVHQLSHGPLPADA